MCVLHHNRIWSAVVKTVKPLTLWCWSCKGCNAARDVFVDCISGVEIAFALGCRAWPHIGAVIIHAQAMQSRRCQDIL